MPLVHVFGKMLRSVQEARYGEAEETCGDLPEKADASETSRPCKTADNCEATCCCETAYCFKTADSRAAPHERQTSPGCEAATDF